MSSNTINVQSSRDSLGKITWYHGWYMIVTFPALEVIKVEFILKLKIKRNHWLADTCLQAAKHCAYFEFETVIKFFNLEARPHSLTWFVHHPLCKSINGS